MLILRTLMRGPMHGYAIAQSIQNASEDILKVEEGSLIPGLAAHAGQGMGDGGVGAERAESPGAILSSDARRGRSSSMPRSTNSAG